MKFCTILLTLGLLMAPLATNHAFARDLDAELFKAISDGNQQQVVSLMDQGADPFVSIQHHFQPKWRGLGRIENALEPAGRHSLVGPNAL